MSGGHYMEQDKIIQMGALKSSKSFGDSLRHKRIEDN